MNYLLLPEVFESVEDLTKHGADFDFSDIFMLLKILAEGLYMREGLQTRCRAP